MKGKWLVVVALAAASGCGGGGGGSSSTPQEPGAEFAFGNLSGRAAATNPPLTTSSSNVVATGLTGTITALRLTDQQASPNELRLIFGSGFHNVDASIDIFTCNLDGSDVVQVTSTPDTIELNPVASPDGKRVAFIADRPGGDTEIFVMNLDGTGRVQLTNNTINDFAPRWHPSGNLLVYYDENRDIQVVNVNTKGITTIVADAFENSTPTFTTDGRSIVFASRNRQGDGSNHLYIAPVVAAAPVSSFWTGVGNQTDPRMAPNGKQLTFFNASLGRQQFKAISGPALDGPDADIADWSPDSKRLVYDRADGTHGIFISDPDGSNEVQVLGDIESDKLWPSFVPAPKEVAFVGSGSLFGSRLAGMIFSQSGPSVRSILGFDANTPSTAVLTRQTPDHSDAPNLVFSVDADVVREISFAHAPYWKPTKVVGGGATIPSANGALVSIDSVTGKIVAVLPFSGARSGKPTFRDEGNTRVFTGNFLGAFDKSGNNVGHAGASEVRLDMSGGVLSTN